MVAGGRAAHPPERDPERIDAEGVTERGDLEYGSSQRIANLRQPSASAFLIRCPGVRCATPGYHVRHLRRPSLLTHGPFASKELGQNFAAVLTENSAGDGSFVVQSTVG